MKIKFLSALLILSLLSYNCFSTHLRSGEIQVKQLEGFTFRITVKVFTDDVDTNVLFGGDGALIDFGDGTFQEVPYVDNIVRLDLDPSGSIAEASYSVIHTYTESGTYTISYVEAYLTEGIMNLLYFENIPFYLETYLVLDPSLPTYGGTPEFLADPIFRCITGDNYSFSTAAIDSNNNQLYYEFVTPKIARSVFVDGYQLPENIHINPYTGLITWDTKFKNSYAVGEFLFTVKIIQINDGQIAGFILRDFQVIVADLESQSTINDNKDLDENGRIFIPEESEYTLKIFAENSSAENIELSAYSELTTIPELLSFETYDSVNDSRQIKVGVLKLTSTLSIVRDNPYAIVIRSKSIINGQYFYKDVGYLLYTKDVELPPIPEVTETEKSIDDFITVYPNPFKDKIFITKSSAETVNIKLYSSQGNVIKQHTAYISNVYSMDDLTTGLYVIEVESKNRITRIRIVKD